MYLGPLTSSTKLGPVSAILSLILQTLGLAETTFTFKSQHSRLKTTCHEGRWNRGQHNIGQSAFFFPLLFWFYCPVILSEICLVGPVILRIVWMKWDFLLVCFSSEGLFSSLFATKCNNSWRIYFWLWFENLEHFWWLKKH